MTDVGVGDLLVRMLVSLAVVLAVVLGAYVVIRRRQGFVPTGPATRRAPAGRGASRQGGTVPGSVAGLLSLAGRGRSAASSTTKLVGNRRGLRILGRVGVGRATQVVALQFADKVLLVGATDTSAPAVLAELDLASWIEATEAPEPGASPLSGTDAAVVREPIDPHVVVPGFHARPGLLDSLREATARRG